MMGKGVRVFNYVGSNFKAGGVEAFLTNVSQGMQEQGIDFIIVLDYGDANIYKEKLAQNQIQVVALHKNRGSFIQKYTDLMKFIRENLRKEDIFVVHASSPAVYFSAFIARACGIKHVMVHLHSTPTKEPIGWAREFETVLFDLLFKWAPTKRVACSRAAGDSTYKNYSYTVVHDGIDAERFRFNAAARNNIRKELGIERKFVIGQVARLSYQKNQRFTIDILAALRGQNIDCCAVFVGEGPKKEELLAYIREKKQEDAVHILAPTDQVQDYYSAFDVFAFPSLFEGLGIVAVEAQAAGLPILCSDQIPDEVMMTRNIWRLPLSAPTEWVERICAVAAQGIDRKQASEEGIRAVSNAGFTIESSQNELIAIYSAMISGSGPETKPE